MLEAELSDTLFRIASGRLRLLRAEVACAQLQYSIQDACGTKQIVCDSIDHLTGLGPLSGANVIVPPFLCWIYHRDCGKIVETVYEFVEVSGYNWV